MVKVFENLSEQEWLAYRAKDITSTEAAAIIGCPDTYKSRLDVWAEKTNLVPSDWNDNERMRWGRRLEATIAAGIAEDHGMQIIKPLAGVYMRHDTVRAGSSFDFLATHPDMDGTGLFEIKNVDSLVFRNKWGADEQGDSFEAPLQIEAQVQHQLWISGYDWAAIGVLVGGNTSHVILRKRDEGAIAAIEAAIVAFWSTVDNGIMPEPDYSRDLDALRAIYGKEDNTNPIPEQQRGEVERLLREFEEAKSKSKACKTVEDEAKAKLVHAIGHHEADTFVDDTGNGIKFTFRTQTSQMKATEARTVSTRVLRTSLVKPRPVRAPAKKAQYQRELVDA